MTGKTSGGVLQNSSRKLKGNTPELLRLVKKIQMVCVACELLFKTKSKYEARFSRCHKCISGLWRFFWRTWALGGATNEADSKSEQFNPVHVPRYTQSGAATPCSSSPLLKPAAILGWRSSRFQSISPLGTSCRPTSRLLSSLSESTGSFYRKNTRSRTTSSRGASRNNLKAPWE